MALLRKMFRAALLGGFSSLLIDLDHLPFLLGLSSESRPLHKLWFAVALGIGFYGVGILRTSVLFSKSEVNEK